VEPILAFYTPAVVYLPPRNPFLLFYSLLEQFGFPLASGSSHNIHLEVSKITIGNEFASTIGRVPRITLNRNLMKRPSLETLIA
jgi:hypothetical protein